jgi:hypothetical protein
MALRPAHRVALRPAHRGTAPFARRALAAFTLGAAISAGGWGVVAAGGAAARGPFLLAFALQAPAGRARFTLLPLGPDPRPASRKHRSAHILEVSAKTSPATRGAVCVRLCDGYFFPLPASTGDAASACDSQCPDAPTEVFYRKGSDRIEDALSAEGRPYTALPVALRYRSHADATCSCHRNAVAHAPLSDPTLRRGDIVMTPAGFVMYQRAGDFAALAKAPLPQAQRVALQAMERASLDRDHPTLEAWLASQGQPRLAQDSPVERVVARAGGDDRIRLLVWRGAQD